MKGCDAGTPDKVCLQSQKPSTPTRKRLAQFISTGTEQTTKKTNTKRPNLYMHTKSN